MDLNDDRRLKAASAGSTALAPAHPRALSPSLPHALRSAAAIVFICGLVYIVGDQRRPLPPAVGSSLSGELVPTTSKPARFRVATFNIHSGTGRDRRFDLARTAAALKGIDLAFLNEVHGPYFWQSSGQAERLAELTGRRWLFAPSEQRWWHHQFGNAVLSTVDAVRWQRLPLPSQGRSCRNAVLLDVEHAGRTIHVLGTHFDRNSPGDRTEQFRAVAGLFLDLAEPAILLGDLNAAADDADIKELLGHEGVHDPLGEMLGAAVEPHIDWILTRGLKTIDAGTIDNGASDHPLVWADLGQEP